MLRCGIGRWKFPRRDGANGKRLKPLKEKTDKAEREVMVLSEEINALDDALAAPGLFARDPAKAGELSKKRAAVAHALAGAEARWLAASEQYEAESAQV